ncbi:MAG TPA: AraC family transcriptional regulator [Candidatus Angelobacter sp.]|nr:AraC family transcriptional regulator [Candidatus Angelobacter sp.]
MDHLVLSAGLLHDETFRRLCRARDLLATEYRNTLSLEQAARQACLSPFHFHRLFTSAFGETPHEFITHRRFALAKRLLAAGEKSVTEICFEIGYSSLGSFSQKFHELAGRSPSEYRREVRKVFGFRVPWHIVFLPACYFSNYAVNE